MAKELAATRDALLRAMNTSSADRDRIMSVLQRSGAAMAIWQPTVRGPIVAEERLAWLQAMRRANPGAFAELHAIAAGHPRGLPRPVTDPGVTAGGSRFDAVGGSIGVAVTGDNTPYAAGDHLDFRDSNFHDQVVGVQHNHYGTVPAAAEWRPVEQVGPLEFGVRPTRHVPGQPDVPPYVPRDCDDDLRAELAHHGMVLILGEQCVGKSYTAWRGVRSLSGHRLYTPDSGEDLRVLLTALQGGPGKYVVWLDELTDHLGEGGLDPRLLGRLAGLGAVVLGTMSSEEYYRRRSGSAPGDRAVAAARTVELAREWSEPELNRLAALDDPRAYPAYMWSGKEGVASYFAVGHLLFDEWRRTGTRLDHPRGQLLVRAAVDLARCGVTGAVSLDLLRTVQEKYGTEERESFEDAFTWATTPLFGVSGLVVQGDEAETWRAYGALVAEALRSGGLEPVPDQVWWVLLDRAQTDAFLDRDALLEAARAALRQRLDEDTELMVSFAARTDADERRELLLRAANAGAATAAEELAAILLEDGDEAAALRYLESAAEGGSGSAAREAGRLHLRRAESWLTTGAKSGDPQANHLLGDLLVAKGDFVEAHECYLEAEKLGYAEVARSAGVYQLLNNAQGKAKVWLERASLGGDVSARELLDAMESPQEDTAEYFAPSPFYPLDYAHYGTLLEAQKDMSQAEDLYRQGYDAGDSYAALCLALLLQRQGKDQQAREWYRKAADMGHRGAKRALGEIPDTVEE